MSGAIISPSLPEINKAFAHQPDAEMLSKLVLTLPALFITLTAPFAGWIIDTFGRKRLLILSLVLYTLAGTSGYYLDNLFIILVGRAFLGLSVSGLMTTVTTLIGDYFDGEERKKFLGLQAASMALGGMFFIMVAGVLADFSWRYTFLMYFAAIAIFPFAWYFLYEPAPHEEEDISTSSSPTEYSKSTVSLIYSLIFFGMILFYIVPVQVPFLLDDLTNSNNTLIGLAIAIAMLFAACGAISYSKIRLYTSYQNAFALSFILSGIGFAIISGAYNYWHVVIGLMIGGYGAGMLMPNGNLWLVEVAPANLRGRLVGGLTTAIFLGQFASPLFSQPIKTAFSLSVMFNVVSVISVLLGMALWGQTMLTNTEKYGENSKRNT